MCRSTTTRSNTSSTTKRTISFSKSCTSCGREHLIMAKGTLKSVSYAQWAEQWTCSKCQANPKRAEEFEKARQAVKIESLNSKKAPAPVVWSAQAEGQQDTVDHDDESDDDLPGRFNVGGTTHKFLGKKKR